MLDKSYISSKNLNMKRLIAAGLALSMAYSGTGLVWADCVDCARACIDEPASGGYYQRCYSRCQALHPCNEPRPTTPTVPSGTVEPPSKGVIGVGMLGGTLAGLAVGSASGGTGAAIAGALIGGLLVGPFIAAGIYRLATGKKRW